MPKAKVSEGAKNRYKLLIEKIFFDRYRKGQSEVKFSRGDLPKAAKEIGIEIPKNLGDVIYSLRYRTSMPDRVRSTQPRGKEWILEGMGRSQYAFKLSRINRIVPNQALVHAKIPDATPEVVAAYALSDEQALLAKVRYNRLIDIFLGIATYSLQNHLRTTVKRIGQVEIDEVYVGIDKHGCQYVLPIQAKGGGDQLSAVQTKQDIACCEEKYPDLLCRPLSAQFVANDLIALFELALVDEEIRVVDEKHYHLVPAEDIGTEDLDSYRTRS